MAFFPQILKPRVLMVCFPQVLKPRILMAFFARSLKPRVLMAFSPYIPLRVPDMAYAEAVYGVWIPNPGPLPIIVSVSLTHNPCLFACFYESVLCVCAFFSTCLSTCVARAACFVPGPATRRSGTTTEWAWVVSASSVGPILGMCLDGFNGDAWMSDAEGAQDDIQVGAAAGVSGPGDTLWRTTAWSAGGLLLQWKRGQWMEVMCQELGCLLLLMKRRPRNNFRTKQREAPAARRCCQLVPALTIEGEAPDT